MMKRIVLTTIFILICVSQAFGDEVDEGLSSMATEALRTATREMIRAGIESEDAIRMTRAMLENRFRQEHIIKAQKIVIRSREEGLPVVPIMYKAHEGMAKRVGEENIIRAMEKVLARYEFAYQKAGELTTDEVNRQRVMKQVAECVAAGVTDRDAERLVSHLRHSIQEMPKEEADDLTIETFRAVKDMARLRVHSMEASNLALEALAHRYGTREMKRMRKSFMNHAKDTLPNTVAEGYLIAIQQGYQWENLDFSDGRGISLGSGRGTMGTGSGGRNGGGAGSPGHGSGGSKGGR